MTQALCILQDYNQTALNHNHHLFSFLPVTIDNVQHHNRKVRRPQDTTWFMGGHLTNNNVLTKNECCKCAAWPVLCYF